MSERTWGTIGNEIRDDYLRADGPENIRFREAQWKVWLAAIERAAAARALEEFANEYNDSSAGSEMLMHAASADYWRGADDAVNHTLGTLRARAAEIREGK